MVMYEIWSLGRKPFEDWDIRDVSACVYTSKQTQSIQ